MAQFGETDYNIGAVATTASLGERLKHLAPSQWGLFPRLLLYLLGVAAVPLIAMSWRADLDARSVLAEARHGQLTSLAEALGRSLDAHLRERELDAAAVAASPVLRELVRDGAWADPARSAAAVEELRTALRDAVGGEAGVVLDRAGTVRLATDPRLLGQQLSALPVAQAALQGSSGVGDVVAVGGQHLLRVAAPIMDLSEVNRVGGAVLLQLSPSDMWALMAGVRAGASGYSVLVDERGTIIGHSSDRSRLFTPFADVSTTFRPGAGGVRSGTALGVDLPMEMPAALSETFASIANQRQQAFATRQLARPGWTVLVAQAEGEAFAPLGTIREAARTTAILVFLFAAVVAAAVAYSISMPVRRMRSVLAAAARGDLSQRVNVRRGDELGKLGAQVDGTLESLATLMREARVAADSASLTSTDVAAATQQQAAAMAEMAATIEELARSAEQVAESADSTLRMAEGARGSVSQGVESLDQVKGRADALAERLTALAEMSQRIGEVADLIGDITNKTHLLSVNAAIEAASAGEFGRRFAIVAQQVKQLADETRDAAGEVKTLIRQTQSAVSAAVMASEGVARGVTSTLDVATETDRAIDHMVHQVRTISLATQQQLSANRQVADAVAGNSDAVKQVAMAMGELDARVRKLRGQIDALGGASAGAVEAAPERSLAPATAPAPAL